MTFHNYLVDIEGHFGNIARVTVTACDKPSAIEKAKAYLLNNLHHTLGDVREFVLVKKIKPKK